MCVDALKDIVNLYLHLSHRPAAVMLELKFEHEFRIPVLFWLYLSMNKRYLAAVCGCFMKIGMMNVLSIFFYDMITVKFLHIKI